MSILRDAIEYLFKRGEERTQLWELHRGRKEVKKVVTLADGTGDVKGEIKTFPVMPRPCVPKCKSAASFGAYLSCVKGSRPARR